MQRAASVSRDDANLGDLQDPCWAQELGNNGSLHTRPCRTTSLSGRKPPAALVVLFPMSKVRQKAERGEIVAKAVVQLLFATGKSFTADGLREKLREFFREEVCAELRRVPALNNLELITALLSSNRQLALVGLQLRVINGMVSLITTEVRNKALAQYWKF